MASTVINGTRTAISRRVVTHLPATVRALEDLRRLRRRDDTTCMEDAVKTIFKATEPKILTEYTPRQLSELAFSIVMVMGRDAHAKEGIDQWLTPVGDEIMRRGAQGFYSKDIGTALETFVSRLPSHPVSSMLAHRGVSLMSSMSCSDLSTVLWSRSLLVAHSGVEDAGLMPDVEAIINDMHRRGFDNLPSVPALFRLLKGIALLPYTSPIVDTVLDALALSLSQQEDYLRGQLQPKQINFLLYALTNDSRVSGMWMGRKRFLQTMLPIVSDHIIDGALSRDAAVSCFKAYARSCRARTAPQQGGGASDADLTQLGREIIARCTPWILRVVSEADTLPVTWLTNLLFVYSSSSETCYDPRTEASVVVLAKALAMLERQLDRIPSVKEGDILSYMARLGIVNKGLLQFCIKNTTPCGRIMRALCKLGVTAEELDSLIASRTPSCEADPKDWLLPIAIAVFNNTDDVLPSAAITQLLDSLGTLSDLSDDAHLGLHILATVGLCEVPTPLTLPSSPWAATVASLLEDRAVTGFAMDNGYTLPVALPREKVSIRLVQPKGYVLDSGSMEISLSAKHRVRGAWLAKLGWSEVCIPMKQWSGMASDEERLKAIVHDKRFRSPA